MDGLPAPDALTPAPAAAPGAAEDVVAVAIGRNEGERLRACGTEVREGLQILTTQPEAVWNRA